MSLGTVAHQASLSMGFSRQEYWSELPFPLQRIFLTQGSNPRVLCCRQILYRLSHQGRPWCSETLAYDTGGLSLSGLKGLRPPYVLVQYFIIWICNPIQVWLAVHCSYTNIERQSISRKESSFNQQSQQSGRMVASCPETNSKDSAQPG